MTDPKLQLAGIFLCIWLGAFCIAAYEVYAAYKCTQAESWSKVSGNITASSVKRESYRRTNGGIQNETSIEFAYKYRYQGKSYTGNRLSFGSIDLLEANYILSDYPKGKRVSVHVNPRFPSESTLEAGFRPTSLILFGISIVTFVCVSGLPWLIKRKGNNPFSYGTVSAQQTHQAEDYDYSEYMERLKSRNSQPVTS